LTMFWPVFMPGSAYPLSFISGKRHLLNIIKKWYRFEKLKNKPGS
jgi:hypothetical protein